MVRAGAYSKDWKSHEVQWRSVAAIGRIQTTIHTHPQPTLTTMHTHVELNPNYIAQCDGPTAGYLPHTGDTHTHTRKIMSTTTTHLGDIPHNLPSSPPPPYHHHQPPPPIHSRIHAYTHPHTHAQREDRKGRVRRDWRDEVK
jgi:hypothetical protein